MKKIEKIFLIVSLILTVNAMSLAKTNKILKNELPKTEREFLEGPESIENEIQQPNVGTVDDDSYPKFFIKKIYLRTPEDKLIVKPLVSEKKLRKIISLYENKEISVLDLQSLVEKINEEYTKKGYITTRVYLEPEQNISEGEIKLVVLEGKIEEVILDNDTKKDRRRVFSAFTNVENRVLNISHIDNGIDNLNRVESNNSKIDIVPGDKQGYSKIIVTSEKKKPIRLVLNYDDTQKDKQKYRINLEYDNLFGINDIFIATYKGDVRKLEKDSEKKDDYTEGYSFSYSFPLKTWTFGLNYDKTDEKNLITGGASNYSYRVKSRQFGVNATKLLYRNENTKLNLSMGLDIKDERTYIDGLQLSTQNRDITVGSIGINGMSKPFKGLLSYSITYSKGMKGFGAAEDKPHNMGINTTPGLNPEDSRYQFGKVNMNLSYYKPFYFKNQGIVSRTTFSGQYSNDALFSIEKYSVGSYDTVKGFPGSVSGDSGYNLKTELSYILPSNPETKWGQFIYRIRPYVEVDLGKVRNNYDIYGNKKDKINTLSSYSLGVRYYGEIVTLDFGIAKPDKGKELMKTDDTRGYISLMMTF